MRADIVPGGTFPDYELTDHSKKRWRLRGAWDCGDCSRHYPYQPTDHQQAANAAG